MASREDVLRTETFKGDVEDVQRRVFYTLTKDDSLQLHRTTKAIALTVATLLDKGMISADELDEFLMQCIH